MPAFDDFDDFGNNEMESDHIFTADFFESRAYQEGHNESILTFTNELMFTNVKFDFALEKWVDPR